MNYSGGGTNNIPVKSIGNKKQGQNGQQNAKNQDFEELATSAPEQRNWKGICLALLVILIICSLVVTAVFLLSPDKEHFVNKPRVRLLDVLDGKFDFRKSNATWISDSEFLYSDSEQALKIFNASSNSSHSLISNNFYRQFTIEEYSLSPDRNYVLFTIDKQKIHKHSFSARYKIFTRTIQKIDDLLPSGQRNTRSRLQYVRWGAKGNQLIYVYRNNIYYAESVYDALNNAATQLTYDGEIGVQFNGIPDWLYEEEIFKTNNLIWCSPGGDYLSFASVNDTEVKSMNYPIYGITSDASYLYPKIESLRYPKPNTKNPTVKLYVVPLRESSKRPFQIRPPIQIQRGEYYLTSVSWIDNIRLSVLWMTRRQNYSLITECSALQLWRCQIRTDVIAPGGPEGKSWVDATESPVHDPKFKMYIRLPITNGRSGYFQHIAKVPFSNGRKQFLTRGDYEVTKILKFDRKSKTLYYTATRPNKPGERHLYSVKDSMHQGYHQPRCLTCELGNKCLFSDVSFSPDCSYYIVECLGPDVPSTILYESKNHSIVRILDDNADVRKFVSQRAMPQNRTFLVPSDFDHNVVVRLYLPPNFREAEAKKYPMVIEAFGGPGTQSVNEKFRADWSTYLTSKRNFIYACIDGKGSGFRGDKLVQDVYGELGNFDVMNQLKVARRLIDTLNFIDDEHIVYWGWGYGGYAVTMAMGEDLGKFLRCGIAVAPITSWIYYNSFFSERYMGPYSENITRYRNADAILKANGVRDRNFMLIHGSSDDRVHFQQSMMLAMALNEHGIMYRSQFYPDEDHDLSGVRNHLYRTMEGFLFDCFDQSDLGFYS